VILVISEAAPFHPTARIAATRSAAYAKRALSAVSRRWSCLAMTPLKVRGRRTTAGALPLVYQRAVHHQRTSPCAGLQVFDKNAK
jgi:hypothetical protein